MQMSKSHVMILKHAVRVLYTDASQAFLFPKTDVSSCRYQSEDLNIYSNISFMELENHIINHTKIEG